MKLDNDFASEISSPVAGRGWLPMEKQASELYTKFMFGLFQDELVGSSDLLVKLIENGGISKFEVTKSGIANSRYTVVRNAFESSMTCSCHKFEFLGCCVGIS